LKGRPRNWLVSSSRPRGGPSLWAIASTPHLRSVSYTTMTPMGISAAMTFQVACEVIKSASRT